MSYENWRITYQSSEAAARSAYEECERLRAELNEQSRLLGMSAEVEIKLPAEIEELKREHEIFDTWLKK